MDATIIPLFKQYADMGIRTFAVNENKRPLRKEDWRTYAAINETPTSEFGDVFAAVVPEDILIVDIDTKKEKKGIESWKQLCTDLGLSEDERKTATVQTPTGGFHLYFTKPANCPATAYKLKSYPDIEFLTSTADQSKYVIGAGSKIGGKEYQVVTPLNQRKPIPAALLTALASAAVAPKKLAGGTKASEFFDTEENIKRFIAYIDKAPGATEGANGDNATYVMACIGRDFGLSHGKTLEIMLSHFNPKCTPPWTEAQIDEKVHHAYHYAKNDQGTLALENQFSLLTTVDAAADAANMHWDLDRDKTLKATLRNCINLLKCRKTLSAAIQKNLFTGAIEVNGPVPWAPHREANSNQWTDEDDLHLKEWLAEEHNVNFSSQDIRETVALTAVKNKYHPVKRYLENLKWDGIPRIDKWLTLYANAADNAYTNKVGVMTLVAAIKRVYNPGCKYDHIMVLEGGQGIFKSTMCQRLAKNWYVCPTALDPKSADAVATLRKGWICEIAEMAAFRGYNADDIKAFLSREVDEVRFAYGHNNMTVKRHGIMIGTFNPNRQVTYLNDPTGNRRFLPIDCGNQALKLTAFERDVDQLWAEAKVRYDAGEETFIRLGSPEYALAEQEISKRLISDAWESIIIEYLVAGNRKAISTTQIFTECLGRPAGACSKGDQMRIAAILKDLGYDKNRNSKSSLYTFNKNKANHLALGQADRLEIIGTTPNDDHFEI